MLSATPAAQALPSSVATLQALNTWSSGTLSALSPAFSAGTTSYTTSASSSTTSITVQPAATDQANATIQIRINGGSYAAIASWGSSTFTLNVGTNTIDTLVTAQDGTTTKLYSIVATRAAAASTDATLSALTLSSGTLSPTFSSGTISYNSSTSLSSITITPTVNQINATVQVKVNSGTFSTVVSGSPSPSLALNIGAYNYIYVQVTAQDGSTTITYTITATRFSTDSTLQSLTLPWPAALSPAFASGTTSYSSSVSSSTSTITVTPAATDQSNATIQVRINAGAYSTVASWVASGSLTLNTGLNTISIKVTAQDGTTVSTYSIAITRAAPASTDASLSALSLSTGSLSPSFATGTYSYSASTAATSITVTPTVNQLNATVQVQVNSGGFVSATSGAASSSLSLSVGSNTIDIKVTAQDGTTILTYSITATRLSSDASLQALNTWSSGTLTSLAPIFASGTISYTESANVTTTSITVQPATTQANATISIRINGGTYSTLASWGTFVPNINYGTNTINVLVTAQDGTSNRLYTLVVTRIALAATAVTATSGDASATISWTASTGATSYTATSSPGNFTCTTSSSSCVITGLTNGTAYSFTVTASNSAGTSAISAASLGVTPIKIVSAPTAVQAPAPLLAPTNVMVSAGDMTATISWTASAGATSYTATSSPGNFTCTTTNTACSVSGLSNGQHYSFTVTATNGSTTTPSSLQTGIITPEGPPPPPPPPVASFDTPVTSLVKADSKEMTKVSATIQPNGSTDLIVSISVPPGAIPSSANFSISPALSASYSEIGAIAVRITATSSEGDLVTHFNKALIVNLGPVSQSAIPVYSQSGDLWTTIPRITGPKLSKDEQEGYYVTFDGSLVILTRHLTFFGVKFGQRPLIISARVTNLSVGRHTRIFMKGGSGRGRRTIAVTTPSICAVTQAGFLRATGAGTCIVSVTKFGDAAYLNSSSLPLSLSIR